MPFALKLYRGSTRIAGPFAGLVLKRRLKRGKEDPTRVSERHGIPSLRVPKGRWCGFMARASGRSCRCFRC